MIKGTSHPAEDWGNGWKRPAFTYTVEEYPGGWKGLWHMLKAAIWPRYQVPLVPHTYTISMFVKADGEYIWYAQLEERHDAESRLQEE